MAGKIERLAAKSAFDPTTSTQTMKVAEARSILFISDQLDCDAKGQLRRVACLRIVVSR